MKMVYLRWRNKQHTALNCKAVGGPNPKTQTQNVDFMVELGFLGFLDFSQKMCGNGFFADPWLRDVKYILGLDNVSFYYLLHFTQARPLVPWTRGYNMTIWDLR